MHASVLGRSLDSSENYRSKIPDEARVRKITLDRTLEIYRESMADAVNFTFVFVGNFNVNAIISVFVFRYMFTCNAQAFHFTI